MRKPKTLSDQLRKIIKKAPMSRYGIAKAIDYPQAGLSRFMTGKGNLSMPTLDRLGALLKLRITAG